MHSDNESTLPSNVHIMLHGNNVFDPDEDDVIPIEKAGQQQFL